MGIPGFVRWLSQEFDVLHAMPSEFECDCLYIDLNGALHVCSHNNNLANVPTFEEIFAATEKHIQELVAQAKPAIRLCLALDGVAPRAKMNQQRGRRFTKIRKNQTVLDHLHKRKELFDSLGLKMDPIPCFFDSNQITPGTEFMQAANEFVHEFARRFAISHPGVKVLVSDSSVHGEGEHKIMDWLRSGDDSLNHVIVGNDSDLYLLLAVSPLENVSIMRRQQQKASRNKKRRSSTGWNLVQMSKFRPQLVSKMGVGDASDDPELSKRLIRDFIFLSSFAGNDFLPALPSLTLHNNSYAFADICSAYRQMRKNLGEFITDGLKINYKAFHQVVDVLQSDESEIIQKISKRFKEKSLPRDQRPRRSRSDGKRQSKRPRSVSKSQSEPPLDSKQKLNVNATEFVPTSDSKPKMEDEPLEKSAEVKEKIPAPVVPVKVDSAEVAEDVLKAEPLTTADATLNVHAAEFVPSPKSLDSAPTPSKDVDEQKQAEIENEKSSATVSDSDKLAEPKENSPLNAKEVAFQPAKMEEADIAPPGPHPLDPVRTQLEYYLSDRNLSRDRMLVTVMNKFGGGRVPLFLIMDFPMIKKKAKSKQEVLDAIALSEKIALDDEECIYRMDGIGIKQLERCADIITGWDDEISFMNKKIEQVDFTKTVYKCDFFDDDWHSSYHETYTDCKSESSVFKLTESFLEGMVWVLDYYLNGIRDWNWFYRNHYPPTVLDLFSYYENKQFSFQQNSPVTPTIQLLSVLPPESGDHIPKCFHQIYTHPEMEHLYPSEFVLDYSGCTRAFQAKCLLPFLEREKLEEIADKFDERTELEKERDKEGKELVYLAETTVHVWEHGKKLGVSRRTLLLGAIAMGGLAFLTRSRWSKILKFA